MIELSEKAEEILDDLPIYLHGDPSVRGLVQGVANELQRVEDYLVDTGSNLQPSQAEGNLLDHWEDFVGLPVEPTGISDDLRRRVITAAVRRRTSGPGSGWAGLLTTVADGQPWIHTENADENLDYEPYNLHLRAALDTVDYRTGVFSDMARRITPAHLKISEIEIAGEDTFRVGESEVGDPI